jgi:hypothetical protein
MVSRRGGIGTTESSQLDGSFGQTTFAMARTVAHASFTPPRWNI